MTTAAPHDAGDLWHALLEQRQRALRVALARGASADEADDVVHETFIRIAGMPCVDLERLGSLVSTIAAHLAADLHRDRMRNVKLQGKLGALATAPAPPEDQVCDAEEVTWLWERRAELGDQDRAVFEMRAAGLSVAQTATGLGLTYKAAEASYTRARARLRTAWRATLGAVAGWLVRPRGEMRGAAVAACAAALIIALLPDWPAGHGATGGNTVTAISAGREVAGSRPADASAKGKPLRERPLTSPRPRAVRRGSSTKRQVVAGTGSVAVGKLHVGGAGVSRRHDDETLSETVARCLKNGIDVSPSHIACRG